MTDPVETTNTPITVSDSNFDSIVSNSSFTIVDFWAEWCAPCKVMHPVMEKLASKYSGTITFAKLNVDQNQEIASKYGVLSIPTFIIFKDGQLVDKVVGAVGEQGLERAISKHI